MSAGTLTLGTHLTVQQDGGGYASLNDAYNNGSIVNLGIISGSVFYISGNSFTNKGTIDVGDQDAVVIRSNNFTNLLGNTLTSGSYFVSAASVLELGNAAIGTLNAKISLTGKGSFIQSYNPTTRLETTLETTLSSIAVSGVLSLLGGRGYSTTMTVKDSGQIVLTAAPSSPPAR